MKEPGVTISLRAKRELWTKINRLVESGVFPDFSHAARALIEAGLWLYENKDVLLDPAESEKLIEEYNSKLNEKDVFDWVAQLSDIQIQGIQHAFDLEKEKRIISKNIS